VINEEAYTLFRNPKMECAFKYFMLFLLGF
jgi:hypothetical protein